MCAYLVYYEKTLLFSIFLNAVSSNESDYLIFMQNVDFLLGIADLTLAPNKIASVFLISTRTIMTHKCA